MEKLKYLSGYEHVAKFQRFMGVDIVEVEKLHSNGDLIENKIQEETTANGTSQNGVHKRDHDVGITNGASLMNGKVHKVESYKNGVHNPEGHETKLAYKIKNKLIYYGMQFSAGLGGEWFYITFFPFMVWNVDTRLSRHMLIIWYLLMYIGQFLKDCVRWPRPGPPAVRLEGKRFELEYGMPSTHTIAGTCIPFSLLYLTSNHYEYPFYIGFTIAVIWTLLVACSRVYLGMHTALDCIVGISLTFALLPWLLANVEQYDYFQVTSPYAPLVSFLIPLLACLYYPKPEVWSITRGDTSNIVSIGVCIGLAAWLNYQLGWMTETPFSKELQPLPAITKQWLFHSLIRTVLGVGALACSRILSKKYFTRLTCYCAGVHPSDISKQREVGLEVPIRWLLIGSMSINTGFTAPLIYWCLGINRPGFYNEVGL